VSYESDKAMYIAAAAEAAAAAVVLMSPIAKSIAVMIGTMISDPGGMQRLAEQWRDSKLGGEAVDLNDLKATITDLRALAEAGGWKGEARQLFDSSSAAFLEETAKLENHRVSAGDTVEQAALIFHVGAQVVFWAAQLMAYLAAVALATMVVPAMRVSAQIAIHQTLRSVGQGLVALIRTKMKVILSATAVLGIVNMYSATQARLLPGLEAVTDKTPDYAGLGFDYRSGSLVPSLDLGGTQQPSGGVLGMF
jgi:hypothetical protein